MNNKEIVRFPSSDGKHSLYGEIYYPNGEPRAIVQLAHGMTDHVGRYAALAKALTERGYAFAGHCHLGHGQSAESESELGFFAKSGGADFVVEDMHRMRGVIEEKLPGVPVVVFGHSMGSFIARIYATTYPSDMKGLIIHGTGGPSGIVKAGRVLVKTMSLFLGKKHRSKFIRKLASRGYNTKFPKEEGRNAWLTRDKELAKAKLTDPLGSYIFTLSAYADLFTLVMRANSEEWFKKYPKDMPTLIVSGDMDPVGGFGKGIICVKDKLAELGQKSLQFKLYEGARHELFNETNREEVFSDIIEWLDGVRV